MMSSSQLIAFVPARDFPTARAFYEGILGLRFVDQDPFALVLDSNGIMVRVAKVTDFKPGPHTVLGWIVKDIKSHVAELEKRGVAFERYGFLEQDEHGIWTAPGGARGAWFKDPDGNVLSLTQLA
jgi:catechol 2,3-dioxygenase-like lactoylglutathione lyase family enzyme